MGLKLDLWLYGNNIGWVFSGQGAEKLLETKRKNVTDGGR